MPPLNPKKLPKDRAKNSKQAFIKLMRFIKPELPLFIVAIVCAILATCFVIVAPSVMGQAVNVISEGAASIARGDAGACVDSKSLLILLIILLALYVAYALFSYLQQFILARVTQNVVFSLRQCTEEKLNTLPISYFDKHSKGDILSRVVNDVDLISSTLQNSLAETVTAVATLIGVCIMMFSINWFMTLLVLVTVPVSMIVTLFIAKRCQHYFLNQQRTLGKLDAHIEESYGGHTELKAFAHEDSAKKEFENLNNTYFGHAWKAQFFSGVVRPLTMFVTNFSYVLICVLGAWMCINGFMMVGGILSFIQYSHNIQRPIGSLASIVSVFQATLAASERVFELLDEKEMSKDVEVNIKLKKVKGDVVFNHVDFGYDNKKMVIHDLCLHVHPGQTLAIVGPTGSGKTTMVNLLMRFYEIETGAILLDGVNIQKMSRANLRKQFGMVLQDTWLFGGSIRENLCYGCGDVSDNQLMDVARLLHMDTFIEALPKGLDTVINEEANNISVGQRQLLTIMRALLANPSILILDEATSSIDTRTECLIQDAMNKLMEGRTCFVIAHRLSTVVNADHILVINNGSIVEQGTHAQLLNQNGFYTELYNAQFARDDEVYNAL